VVPVVAVRTAPVVVLVAFMLAPGTPALLESRIVPVMLAV
jgi:hypothetical protein